MLFPKGVACTSKRREGSKKYSKVETPKYIPEKSISSPKGDFVFKSTRILKPQLTRKGVVIREIPAPVSPASKKRRAHDMVLKIKKKQKKLQDPLDEVAVETNFKDDGS